MTDIPRSFDGLSFLVTTPQYCENKDCEEFGYVTMVGIPEDTQSQTGS
jgi:hypothetical protein